MFGHTRALIALCLGLIALLRPAPAAAAYTYQPFGEVPATTVKESGFVEALRVACADLAAAPVAAPPQVCAPAGAAPAATLSLSIASARTLPIAPAVAGCTAQAQADLDAITKVVNDLKTTCAKLRAAVPTALAAPDLLTLRLALEAPEILETVHQWKAAAYAQGSFVVAVKGSAGKVAGAAGAAPISLGSLSDQLIRGMAEFLAKRAKEEALRYLRDELKKQLCEGDDKDDSVRVRKAAFSNVCLALETLDDGMSLEAIGSYIRAAAEKDLRKLPDIALDYIEQAKPASASVAFSARAGLAYFEAVRHGRHPLEVLYSFGELPLRSCEAGTCAVPSQALRLASALAYALRQGGEDWQQAFDSTLAVQDRPVVAVALVLLAEARLTNLGAPRSLGFQVVVADLNRIVLDPLGLVTDAVALVTSWQALEKRLKGELSSEARRDALAETMVECAERATRLVETFDRVRTGAVNPTVTKAMAQARTFVSVAASAVRRDYADAVVVTLAQLKDTHASSLPAPLTKYLPLVVEIASAQSSNDVAAAFDAYAAPIGTYKLKYERAMVSINGFLGAHYGWEKLNSGGVKGTHTIVGGFAPIGVHASFPIKKWVHLGVLLSVADLGAVTTAQTDDDEPLEGELEGADPMTTPKASAAAKIGFEQVFSPGAYLVVGIARTPFVAGFGASLSPELREVQQDGLKTEASVLRYGAFLAVDVPILPFN